MTAGAVRRAAASREPLSSTLLDDAMRNYFRRKFDGVPDAELELRIEEALRFLFISHECKGSIPVSRDIDDIWHAWILQTQQYFALCEQLPAGRYVHHSSNDYLRHFDPRIGEQEDLHEAVRMLALYVANFGPFDERSAEHWLLVRHMITRWGWTLPQINDWLMAADPGAQRRLTQGSGDRTAMRSGELPQDPALVDPAIPLRSVSTPSQHRAVATASDAGAACPKAAHSADAYRRGQAALPQNCGARDPVRD